MEKKELITALDDIFQPLGFKRKGNNWVLNDPDIIKIVNLQKSNFGNFFYLNYGFIIPGIELTTKTHVESRLGSIDKDEQQRIGELLDLDAEIATEERCFELKTLIIEKIIPRFQSVNTEVELLSELRNRPHLNDIPLVVKKYFGLSQ